jgi:hypothetical protein
MLTPQAMSSNRQPPVDWNQLKKIQDENPPPRVAGGAVVAVVLLGLSGICFFLAIYLALDPEEMIEPARYFIFAVAAFGLLAGWAGVMFMLHEPPPGSAKGG